MLPDTKPRADKVGFDHFPITAHLQAVYPYTTANEQNKIYNNKLTVTRLFFQNIIYLFAFNNIPMCS